MRRESRSTFRSPSVRARGSAPASRPGCRPQTRSPSSRHRPRAACRAGGWQRRRALSRGSDGRAGASHAAIALSSRTPCQCTVEGWGSPFTKRRVTRSPWRTRIVGPGTRPSYPQMGVSGYSGGARRAVPGLACSVTPSSSRERTGDTARTEPQSNADPAPRCRNSRLETAAALITPLALRPRMPHRPAKYRRTAPCVGVSDMPVPAPSAASSCTEAASQSRLPA